jgi:hypothetical protein
VVAADGWGERVGGGDDDKRKKKKKRVTLFWGNRRFLQFDILNRGNTVKASFRVMLKLGQKLASG